MPVPTRSLEDWLQLQERAHPRAIELGLDRIRIVAGRLQLPAPITTLTVAGTNGKGSSASLAAGIWRAAGHRVGLYTSPHLLRYEERVQIDGVPVDAAGLCAAFAAIEAVRGEVPLTYFEYGTLAALWLFRAAAVDVQVLEVGLGGRLDAVNLVDADVALLTNVGLDHQDWLGETREDIGREKAGVFRRGRPAIVVEAQPPQSVLDAAVQIGAPLLRLGTDFDCERVDDGRWHWRSGGRSLRELPAPALRGAIQYCNASGVLAAVEALQPRLPVTPAAITAALAGLRLRGRCESYHGVLLDVAHNAEAAAALADVLYDGSRQRTAMILGMLSDKPVEAVGMALAQHVDSWVAVGLPSPRGLTAAEVQRRLGTVGLDASCCENMQEALALARERAGSGGRVVVSGSFLTVAAAIRELEAHG